MVGGKIVRGDIDEEGTVDVLLIPGVSLMPLVTTRPVSEAAATTVPPGQTQKEKALRPLSKWQLSL